MRVYAHRNFSQRAVIQKLKSKREELGLLKADLARQAGVAPSTLYHLEMYDKFPNLDTLVRLCARLGFSLDELVGFKEASPQTLGLEELKAISHLRKMSEPMRKVALKVLEDMAAIKRR